jgi:transposase
MDLNQESLADIPLIIEFCKRLNIQSIINESFPTHGNQVGLSNGQIILGWVAHILTQNNHCKSPVQDFINSHKMTLEALLGCQISDTDFEDCRLGRLLEKFANDSMWHSLEKLFYNNSFAILNLNTSPPRELTEDFSIETTISKTIKIDATTAYGHHEVIENEIMQHGFSKDRRPDLPQLKIMVSVEGNTGLQIASDVVAGNENDDLLYIPIISRTRKITDTEGCLMCGDSKMSAISIRADIMKNREFYLMPLQLHQGTKKTLQELVDKVVDGDQEVYLIDDVNDKNIKRLIGAGFEVERDQLYEETNNQEVKTLKWKERILLVRSFDHADQEMRKFNKKLSKLTETLIGIKGKICANKEKAEFDLLNALNKINIENELLYSLCEISVELVAEEKECKRSEKRNGKVRSGTFKLIKYRAIVSNVKINTEKLKAIIRKMGWRLYVTNAEKSSLTLASAYRFFRKTMFVIEIGFHILKDYINISPLFVKKPDQILGMTRLLILALKILTLMTAELRANMKKENIVLKGLYAGQPVRQHPSPTIESVLDYFTRNSPSLIGHKINDVWFWGVTKLTDTCRHILRLLGLSEDVYDNLPKKLLMG